MKKIMLFIMAFSFFPPATYAQQKRKGGDLSVDAELDWLLHYKREYERFTISADRPGIAKDLKDKYTHKRNSMYKLYVDQIELIRSSPEKFLTHIDRSIMNNNVGFDGPPKVLYDYVNPALPFDPDIHGLTRLELYKIVKKYVFEKRDKLLPHQTEAYTFGSDQKVAIS